MASGAKVFFFIKVGVTMVYLATFLARDSKQGNT